MELLIMSARHVEIFVKPVIKITRIILNVRLAFREDIYFKMPVEQLVRISQPEITLMMVLRMNVKPVTWVVMFVRAQN